MHQSLGQLHVPNPTSFELILRNLLATAKGKIFQMSQMSILNFLPTCQTAQVGFSRFYGTVSGNFIRTANWLALLLILVPLLETELADNI